MVASRLLRPADRARVQEEFTELVARLNEMHREQVRAKFVITLGDEFQGLLRSPEIIPRLIWELERSFTSRELRLGFGYGRLHTSIPEYAINIDGPAFHNARASIEAARKQVLKGGVFTGFGTALDPALNGLARVLHHQRTTWPARQRQVAELLHDGWKRTDIARDPDHYEAGGIPLTRHSPVGMRTPKLNADGLNCCGRWTPTERHEHDAADCRCAVVVARNQLSGECRSPQWAARARLSPGQRSHVADGSSYGRPSQRC